MEAVLGCPFSPVVLLDQSLGLSEGDSGLAAVSWSGGGGGGGGGAVVELRKTLTHTRTLGFGEGTWFKLDAEGALQTLPLGC